MGYDSDNYRRRLQLARQKLVEDGNIIDINREHILKFLDFSEARGLSESRLTKLAWSLRFWGHQFSKDFKTATRDDLVQVVRTLEGHSYKPQTKSDLKRVIKLFWKWLFNCKQGENHPDVAWISVKFRPTRLSPDDLLTKEEVDRMVAAGRNPMEKALISVLFETGARIGEVLSVRLNNVSHDRLGSRLMVDGKVGPRSVRVMTAQPYLTRWLDCHPQRNDPSAPLWLNHWGKPMQNHHANIIIKKLAVIAGIKKRVYPYLCRHSSITAAAPFLKESVMKEVFGWTQSSNMPAVYVHLGPRDIDAALQRMYGIPVEDSVQKNTIVKRTCPRCSLENPAADRFCARCGMPMDPKEIVEIHALENKIEQADAILAQVLKDPQIKDILTQRIQEIARMKTAPKRTQEQENEQTVSLCVGD